MARSLSTLVSLLLLLLLPLGASAFKQGSHNRAAFVPNSYFIEVDASSRTLTKRGLTPFDVLSRTLAAVENSGVLVDIRQRFEDLPDVFHGVSVKVAEGTTMEQLAALEGVKNVWPVQLLGRPIEPAVADASSFISSAISNFTTLISTKLGVPPKAAYRGETYYPHVQTGVAALHNAGFLGQGVKIAVLDNGVDYTNPILGGCFGSGCHISFGHAFVDDSYTGVETPVESDDPYSACSTHGTHVTGIVGALANELGFSGVAPKATLGHYRVLGCTGFAGEDVLVAAMMRAHHEGVNVVSMSIAGGVGWLDVTPSQIVVEYLSSQGVHVVAAGGNERTEGLFTTDEPGATVQGTVVGAVDTLYYPAYNATLSGGADPLPYTSPTPLNNLTGTYPLYFVSTNSSTTNDACSALPASTPDLSNSVVVVQRGGCDFVVKQRNVAAAGGKILLIYNSAGSLSIPQLNTGATGLDGVASLRYEDGIRLLSDYLVNRKITITFPFGKLVPYIADDVSGGTISYYSNYGPTNELYMYPTLVAPGTNILSTVPGGVAIMRGSSMSTPYHAGALAVLLGARKSDKLTPAQAKSIFMTTNSLVPTNVGASSYEPIVSQGAGVIDVNRAVAARTLFSPSQFLLNDTLHSNYTQTLRIENRNSFPVSYQLTGVDAEGVATFNNGASVDGIPSTTPAASSAAAIRVAFSRRLVTVPAFSTGTVQVTVIPPNLTAAERDKFPIYSGWVKIVGRGTGSGRGRLQTFTIPYFGLAARMYDLPVLDTTDVALGAFLPFLAKGQDIQTGPLTYTSSNAPTAYFRLASGTRRLNVDLVDADIDFTGTVPPVTNPDMRLVKRSYSHLDFVKRATPTLYADVPVHGSIYTPDFTPPRDYLLNFPGFSDYEIEFNGTYTDTTGKSAKVVAGKSYRMLIRALKITGNPLLSGDYDSWLSPPFSFTTVA
ncbi:hypothetical protein JCM10213_000413 [Rhodosporidiobolus nylandii]